jgi:hypothetical protein
MSELTYTFYFDIMISTPLKKGDDKMGDIRNVKAQYTDKQWEAREQYYMQELSYINLPEAPTSKDIMKIAALSDSLLTEALMDYAYIKRKFEIINNKVKNSKESLFSKIKHGQIGTAPTAKLTEAEIKGMVIGYMETNILEETKKEDKDGNITGLTILQLHEKALERNEYITSVVKSLTEKKASLITDAGVLKIESNI